VPIPGAETQTDPTSQITESWTLAPSRSDNPNETGNRPNLSYFAAPGAVIKDSVTVVNFGNVTETFRVYATDAFNDAGGNFALLAGDKKPADVGTWVSIEQENITLLPGKQASFPITIKIPRDAVPGDHVGAILASSPTIGTGTEGQILTLDRRTGTRLYVRVNGDLHPDLEVADVKTEYRHAKSPFGGKAKVTFRIENRGNIRLSATPTVSVSGLFGLDPTKVKLADIPELLPGETVTLTKELTGVPAFMVDFTKVRLAVHGATDARAAEGTATTFAPPITLLILALPLVLIVLALRHRGRRTPRPPMAPNRNAQQASMRELDHSPT
jgi:hypothetical protein